MQSSSGMSARVVLSLVVAAVVILSVMTRSTQANSVMAPSHCNPNMMDSLPPRLQRICNALVGIAEISSAVENYLDEKIKILRRLGMQNGYPVEGDRGVKRQDVDHVFLRFGRR